MLYERFLRRYDPKWERLWTSLSKRPRICLRKRDDDGRSHSLASEASVICAIRRILGPTHVRTASTARSWYDVAITFGDKTHYANIKISNGGCDNAFNKKALVWSLTTLHADAIPNSMSMNEMHTLIMKHPRKKRCPGQKEYFFIYVDKRDGTILIKSIMDIRHWCSNPYNLLQINWRKEKASAAEGRSRTSIAMCREAIFACLSQSLQDYVDSVDALLR